MAVLLLLTLVAAAVVSGGAPLELCAAYAVMGVISVFLYRADKQFAENGQWRISEAMLLGVDLGFGIIGGLLAQALFRHKTRKPGFVAATLLLTGLHAAFLVGLATGWLRMDNLMRLAGG